MININDDGDDDGDSNNQDDVYMLSSVAKSLREFSQVTWMNVDRRQLV